MSRSVRLVRIAVPATMVGALLVGGAVSPASAVGDSATLTAPARASSGDSFTVVARGHIETSDPYSDCYLLLHATGPGGFFSDMFMEDSTTVNYPVTYGYFPLGTFRWQVLKRCGNGDTVLAMKTTVIDSQIVSDGPQVFPSATGSARTFTAAAITPASVPVTFTFLRGAAVMNRAVVGGKQHSYAYPLSRTYTPEGTYTLRINIPGVPTINKAVTVRWGWAPMEPGLPAWKTCRVIPWYYDHTGAPGNVSAASMIGDANAAFDTVSRTTGLVFKRVSSKVAANYVLDWKGRASGNTAGYGGYTSTRVGNKSVIGSGYVHLVPSAPWAQTPANAPNGRGPLLLHEIGHTVGLNHVGETTSLMTPTAVFGKTARSYTAEEQRGLHTLYAPQTCPTWSAAREPKPAPVVLPPSQPAAIAVQLSSTTATIIWTPPTDFPSRVTGYYVYDVVSTPTYSSWRSFAWTSPSQKYIRVARPAAGSRSIAVSASSASGESAFSTTVVVPHR